MAEKTGIQVRFTPSDSTLPKDGAGTWYAKVRKMRKDPTISLARTLVVAPVLGSSWSYESSNEAPEGAKEFIQGQVDDLRLKTLDFIMRSWLDFGWAPFEKVFELRNGAYVIRKLKPLLHDITEILIDVKTGSFAGFEQDADTGTITLKVQEALCLSHEPEGAYLYGQPIMGNAESAYDGHIEVSNSNSRYDKRIAGSHWVIKYPVGTTEYNGVETDNYNIAERILAALESSGRIILPRIKDDIISLNSSAAVEDAWSIEILSDGGASQTSFIERCRYLDVLKVRALGLPERSILEGQHGTKAEAGEHADFAIFSMELKHRMICQDLNWHLINQLMRLNYGEQYENTVWIEPAPLADEAISFLRSIYTAILANPQGFIHELTDLDTKALKERLQIPIAVQDNMDVMYDDSITTVQ